MVPALGWIIEGFDRIARRIAESTGFQRGFQRTVDRYNPLTIQTYPHPNRIRDQYKWSASHSQA